MTNIVLLQLDRLGRNVMPVVLSLFLVMVGSLPFHLPYFGLVAPNLAIMAVFYWTVYRPDLIPASAVFAIGLWQDLVTGSPPGLNAGVLVAVHAVLSAQRRFFQGKSFLVVWWAFGIVAMGASLLAWLVFMMVSLHIVDGTPVVFQYGLTLALYPFVTWLFAWLHHSLLRPQ